MDTRIHIPLEEPLRDSVQFFWQINRNNANFSHEVIVPKGFVEIIFNFLPEATFSARLYNKNFSIPRCFIQGYHDLPIKLELPRNQSFFGVVLHTTAVKHLLGVPAGEFAGYCTDLTLVDASFNSLWHRLAEEETFRGRVSIFSDWLIKYPPCLTNREQALNELFTIKTAQPLSVPDIADWLCYSPRHLSRKCYELTGMNTEQTLLYLKYLRAISQIHHSTLSLTEIAYLCEFADQSHFIKTFKSLTTLTPTAYKKKMSEVVGHYFENVR